MAKIIPLNSLTSKSVQGDHVRVNYSTSAIVLNAHNAVKTTEVIQDTLLSHLSTSEANDVSLSTNMANSNSATEKSTLLESQVSILQDEIAAVKEEVKTLSLSHRSLEDQRNRESNRLYSLSDEVINLKDKNILPGPDWDAICTNIWMISGIG